jgi:thiosulfate/3-mercaptopyruvate sulfurtransferase
MTFIQPPYLVETDWLEAHLSEPDLRVLDCTVLFHSDAHGIRMDNGREAWAQGHIPGSGFADLMGGLSDRNSRLPFMMPPATQFAEVSAFNRERVITYCGGGIAASSDAFVLTLLGVTNVAVYDGSLVEWAADPTLPMATD